MKLLKSLLLLAGLSLMAASCTKEYYTEEYYSGSQITSYVYEIQPSEWQTESASDGRNYLYAEIENPDITDELVNNGMITSSVYYVYNQEKNLGSWNDLPYVFPCTINDSTVVGENIRYEYEPGYITFVIEDLNGLTPEQMKGSITFKVNVAEDKR